MRIDEAVILNEAVSDVVYHGTDLSSFQNIIRTNKFKLMPAFTKDVEAIHGGGKMYYMSTSRNRSAPYHQDSDVLITLNGRKLNQRYSGRAVDYYGEWMRKIQPSKFEQEDRVVSDSTHIDNAMSYMMRVDIMVGSGNIKQAMDVYAYLKRKGVPVYLYEDNASWNSTNPNSHMTMDDIRDMSSSGVTGRSADPAFLYKSRQRMKERSPLINYLRALKVDNPNHLLDLNEIKTFLMYHTPGKQSSTLNQFKNEFANAYRNETLRNVLEEIGREMRKRKLGNLEELADFIYYKWRGILYGESQ